jgi:two-component system, sensor histidine kinase
MSSTRPLRVLHVDDDAINRLVLDQMLQAFGYETVAAASGAEALAAVRASRFDLVMTDLHMPQMTGEALLAAIRAAGPQHAALPVIAVSADVMSRPAAVYAQMGFAGFLAKPLTFDRLEAAIDRARFGDESANLDQADARMRAYLKAAGAR